MARLVFEHERIFFLGLWFELAFSHRYGRRSNEVTVLHTDSLAMLVLSVCWRNDHRFAQSRTWQRSETDRSTGWNAQSVLGNLCQSTLSIRVSLANRERDCYPLFSRDDIEVLWKYLEALMSQLNVQLNDLATVAMAYDTRFVSKEYLSRRSCKDKHVPEPVVHFSLRLFNVLQRSSIRLSWITVIESTCFNNESIFSLIRTTDHTAASLHHSFLQRWRTLWKADGSRLFHKTMHGIPNITSRRGIAIDASSWFIQGYVIDHTRC